MNGATLIRLLGLWAMLMVTIAPVDHCATGDSSAVDACCASIPAEPGQSSPASLPDTSRDCAGHHLAPCCSDMFTLTVAAVLPSLVSAPHHAETASREFRAALRSSDPLRPPIAIS